MTEYLKDEKPQMTSTKSLEGNGINVSTTNENENKRKKNIRNVAIYCFLVLVLAFIAPVLGGSPAILGLGFILWTTLPLIVAMGIRLVTRDWEDTGIALPLKKNLKWIIFSFVISPITLIFTVFTGVIISASEVSGFSFPEYAVIIIFASIFFFIFAIFEEFGWRGYLAPKLNSIGINDSIGYLITSVVWTTWHLPYIRELTWIYSSESLELFILRYYLFCFALTIVYNEIRLITNSVWPPVLMHAISNSIQHPFVAEYLKINPSMDFFVSTTGLFAIIFVASIGISLNQIRKRTANISK